MLRHFFSYLAVLFFLGCTVIPEPLSHTKIEALSKLLRFKNTIPRKERLHLARAIYAKTHELTEEFELTSPPLWHNTLVNIGIKEKGLCYHWSDALYLGLDKKSYAHYDFYLVSANIGEYFFEHNALLITAKGASISEGIIIDGWRDSGRLYATRVKDDTEYQWIERKVYFPTLL
jgi:hypothetical protein